MTAAWLRVLQLGGVAVLAPSPVLFACACTCGPGSPVPSVPEAPWQPLLVAGGVIGVLIVRARRGRGGGHTPGGSGGTGSPPPLPRRGWLRKLGLAAARIAFLVVTLSVASGAASAAVIAATPPPTPVTGPCDCRYGDSRGDTWSPNSPPVPAAGAAIEVARFAAPLVAGGAAVIGGAYLIRPRRRR